MLKVYCPYSVLDLGWKTSKNLQNITFKKPWYLKGITMSQEEKELLLKDLSARLPYGTIYDIKIGGVTYVKVSLNSFYYGLIEKNFSNGQLQSIIPYLRKNDTSFEHKGFYLENLNDVIDYYNSNHVDYRGLIEKGLAIEVTEENNPYKE